jgi:hypothetical protein
VTCIDCKLREVDEHYSWWCKQISYEWRLIPTDYGYKNAPPWCIAAANRESEADNANNNNQP